MKTEAIKFTELMTVAKAYYNKTVSPAVQDIYWQNLARYGMDAVGKAFSEHTRHGKFFPTVAEIVEILDGSVADQAQLAWNSITDAFGSVGAYRSVDFGPAANQVIQDMGGWQALCLTDDKEMPFKQREFKDRLRIQIKRGGEGVKYLPGIIETDNRKAGLVEHIEPPVKVSGAGDKPFCGAYLQAYRQ